MYNLCIHSIFNLDNIKDIVLVMRLNQITSLWNITLRISDLIAKRIELELRLISFLIQTTVSQAL